MTARPGVANGLFWLSVPLGVAALGFAVYFGIDVVKIWTRPAGPPAKPLTADASAIDVAARGLNASVDLLGGMADGIAQGLFFAALAVLVFAGGLFYLSRKLR